MQRLCAYDYKCVGKKTQWRKKFIAEREGNTWLVRYLLGLKPCGFVMNGQVRIYHADRLGSIRWVTDEGQNIMVSYVYEGFGKIIGQNGGGGGPYQFCGIWGYRNDWDAGLLHVGARYYEFEIGRFVQKDPLLDEHLYVYANNLSTQYVDPKGTCVKLPGKKWVCVVPLPGGSYAVIIDPNLAPEPGPFVPKPPLDPTIVIIDYDPGKKSPDIVLIPLPIPKGRRPIYIDDGKIVPIPLPKPPKIEPKPPKRPPIDV